MSIVDIHVHVYPQKIAAKAVDAVGQFYLLGMYGDGSPAHYTQGMERAGITHAVVHSVADKPSNVESIDTYIAEECAKDARLTGFMTMHPDYADPEAEIERALELGLCGMKIHPDIQRVNADDPRLMRVYEMIEGRMPLIIHAGDYRYDYSHPRRIANICHAFPNLKVDAAHFGGWSVYDLAVEYLEHENCYVDCSSSFALLGQRRSRELIEIYGAERVLFGTDFPMWDPQSELDFLYGLGLSEADLENITWRNAERFVGKTFE